MKFKCQSTDRWFKNLYVLALQTWNRTNESKTTINISKYIIFILMLTKFNMCIVHIFLCSRHDHWLKTAIYRHCKWWKIERERKNEWMLSVGWVEFISSSYQMLATQSFVSKYGYGDLSLKLKSSRRLCRRSDQYQNTSYAIILRDVLSLFLFIYDDPHERMNYFLKISTT